MLEAEKIQENYSKFNTFLTRKTDPSKLEGLEAMFSSLEERICMAPASSKTTFYHAYPGGLVQHSLEVLQFASKYHKIVDPNVPVEKVVFVSLVHELGKIGDLTNDLYIPASTEWQKKNNIAYEINQNLNQLSMNQRTLWLLNHFKIPVEQDEYVALSCNNDGYLLDANKWLQYSEPSLAIILMQADRTAILSAKTQGKQSK